MIIQKNKDVLYNYNKKKKELFFIFYTKNSFIYTVKGWFGKKLYELLKSGEALEEFLDAADFKANSKLVEVFKRLIVTLIQEDIFGPPTHNHLNSISPFSKEEYLDFGEGDLMGNFVIENINQNEILAYGYHQSYWKEECDAGYATNENECHSIGGTWQDNYIYVEH